MKSFRIAALAVALSVALASAAVAGYADLPAVDVRAAAAILADAKTGELLYEKNIHDRRMPASITKVMTCLLALEYAQEQGCMDEVVTVSEEALADMAPDGSSQNLQPGEELVYRDLLYCAMISSANDACNVLAIRVSGSISAFVALMNERAAAIGMTDTHFINTHGMPDPAHYSTAYDIYLMCLEAMKSPALMGIAHTETYAVPPTNKTPQGRTLNTTNHLISKRVYPDYIYPYARGIKTGHTKDAGNCLASSAEKNGLALISVVLGAEKEESGTVRSFVETRELFEWAFNNFTQKRLLSKTDVITSVPVIEGLNNDRVELVPEAEVSALVPITVNPEDIKREIKVFEPEGTLAPVLKGQVMGTLTLSLEGRSFGAVNLVSLTAEERSATEELKNKVIGVVSQPWVKWAVLAVVAAVFLYITLTVWYNVRRRKRSQTAYQNYKGKKHRHK